MAPYESILIFGRHVPPLAMLTMANLN